LSNYLNAAARVYGFIEKAKAQNPSEAAAMTWARVFDLDPTKSNIDSHEVQAHLRMLREEIESIVVLMNESSFSRDLYLPYISDLRSMISAPNLASPWSSYVHLASPETMLALRFLREIIAEEDSIDIEELQDLLDKLYAFRTELDSSAISKAQRDFFLDQLNIIERGIKEYPIRGAKSLKKSFKEGLSEVVLAEEILKEPNAEKEKGMLSELWDKTIKAGNLADDLSKAGNSIVKLIGTASVLGAAIKPLIS